MASVNKVIIIGTSGRDTEVRYLTSGTAVANVSLATNSRWKDRDGTPKEETQWHRITFYDKLAEIAGQYLKKGTVAYIEGSLKYGTYVDGNGVEKNTTEIVARELTLIRSPRQDGQQQDDQQYAAPQGQQRQQQPQGQQRQQQPQG